MVRRLLFVPSNILCSFTELRGAFGGLGASLGSRLGGGDKDAKPDAKDGKGKGSDAKAAAASTEDLYKALAQWDFVSMPVLIDEFMDAQNAMTSVL